MKCPGKSEDIDHGKREKGFISCCSRFDGKAGDSGILLALTACTLRAIIALFFGWFVDERHRAHSKRD